MASFSRKFRVFGLIAVSMLIVQLGQPQAGNLRAADPSGGFEPSGGFNPLAILGGKSKTQKREVIGELPLDRLTHKARQQITSVTSAPTLYRRLPSQSILSDRDIFLCMSRNPEIIVGMWELMGITQVKTVRMGPYQLDAEDGSGTKCRVDLLYGDSNIHIFYATGSYDGKYVTKPVYGRGVFVLRSQYARSRDGSTTVTGTLDCFVKFDSLGADLVVRTLGGLIGKAADHNFVETARFISQVSQACETRPQAMVDMAGRLPQVDEQTKTKFARLIVQAAKRADTVASVPTRPKR